MGKTTNPPANKKAETRLTKPFLREKIWFFLKLHKVKIIFIVLTILFVVVIILLKNTGQSNKVSKSIKAKEKATVSYQEATLDIPKDTINKDTTITIKDIKAPKLTDTSLEYAGQVYRFSSTQEKFDQPVVITLKYDPARLPDPSYENYLFIGFWENGKWVPLEGGIINKTDKSLSAPVEHFTDFTVLLRLVEKIKETAGEICAVCFQDTIESIPYEQLPNGVAASVDYSKSDIAFIHKIQVSIATKASTFIISAANVVSKVAGILIGGQLAEEELQEALEETTATEIIAGGGAAGELTVKAYKIAEGGKIAGELATTGIAVVKGIKDAASLSVIYAKAVAWGLDVEMDYINSNMDEPFKNLWQFGSVGERLTLYIVYIDAPYKNDMHTKGMKYYYYNKAQDKFINYFNNLVGIKSEFKKAEEITPSSQVTVPEKVITPAMTTPPSPQVKTTTGITTVSEFNKLPAGDYGCAIFSNDPKKPITMELTINSYDGLYYLYYDFYKAKDSSGEIDVAVQHRDMSAPDWWIVPTTKLESGKTYILTGCKPYIGTGGPGEGPIVFGVREDWEGSIVEKK